MTNQEFNPIRPGADEPFHSPTADVESADSLSLRDLINIWVRRRWLIIGLIAVGVMCAVLLVVFQKAVYQATATVELNKESGNSSSLDISSEIDTLGLGGGDLNTDLKTEVEVLQSDALAMMVMKRLNLPAQPPFLEKNHPPVDLRSTVNLSPSERTRLLKIFHAHLHVDLVGGTRLIRVYFRSHNPQQAADVANAIIDSYNEIYFQAHFAAVSDASDWMTQQLSRLKRDLKSSEKQLSDFETTNGILIVPTETTLPTGENLGGGQLHSPEIQRLDELNAELIVAETDRIQKEAIYRLAATGNPSVVLGLEASPITKGSSIAALSGGRLDLQVLGGLESTRSQLLVEIAQGRSVYGPNNRHFKDLQTQLDSIDAQVHGEMKKITDHAAADMKVAQQTEDAIRGRFNDAHHKAESLNGKNIQLAILTQEAFSRKKLYENLFTRLQEMQISAGTKATNITVVDPAFAPSTPVAPRPIRYIGLGFLIGALLGFGAAHLVESIDTTVISLPEIEETTGSAVLAVIPNFKETSPRKKSRGEKLAQEKELQPEQSKAWILSRPTSAASEAFRTLRTSVFLARPGGIPRTLLITSSVPAEGKSTVAFNLAVAIAQSGRKVIIIEADLRRPAFKRYLNMENDVGLSSVLADVVSLDDAIIHGVGTANLDVMPAGPVPPLPAELLSSTKFDSVLEELRTRYDNVLIDSPPALIVTDAIAIAPRVDGVVWIVRSGKATRPHLMRAAQQVRRSRMPLIGYVLNGLDSRIDPYGYGYSYYGHDSKEYGAYYGEDSNSGT